VNLALVDLDRLDREDRFRILLHRYGTYTGPLTARQLRHLADLAQERERRNEEKLASLFGQPALGAFAAGGPA